MEPWQYSALQSQFSSLLQLLTENSPTSRAKPSSDNQTDTGDMQAMSVDTLNNTISGVKRKITDDDEQVEFPRKKQSSRHQMSSKLCLDMYTQTSASYLTEQNCTLVNITDIVMENQRRLEDIEQFLLSIDKKISLLGTGTTINNNDKKQVETKPTSFEVSRTPVTPGYGVTPGPASELLVPSEAKSLLVPLLPSVLRIQAIPESDQQPTSNTEWPHNQMQRSDSFSKHSHHDVKAEPQLKGLDMSMLDAASSILVPVIFAPVDKAKRSSTTEIALQDLLNGNVTHPEESEAIFRGCWLGDRLDPDSRIWYYGDPKTIQRAEASGTTPAKLSLNLLEGLFTREEMAASNVNGARGRELLDPIKIKAIYVHVNHKFPTEPDKQELRWHLLKPRIDSKCRAQRRLLQDHQAVGEVHPSCKTSAKPFRTKGKPALDPKVKEELLYGFARSDSIGLSSLQAGVVQSTYHGESGVDVNGNSQHHAIHPIQSTLSFSSSTL